MSLTIKPVFVICWTTLNRTREDMIGDINANEIQAGEIVSNPLCWERKSGNHLTHFEDPVIAKVSIVSHLWTVTRPIF